MAKNAHRGPKFVLTRVMLVSLIGALLVGLWTAITVSAAKEDQPDVGVVADPTVIEQDGWRWDEEAQDWVLIDDLAPSAVAVAEPTPAPGQVIIVQRQQEVHYIYYREQAAESGQSSGAASEPAAEMPDTATSVAAQPAPTGPSASSGPAVQPPAAATPPQAAAPAPPSEPAPAPVWPTPVPPAPLPPTPIPPTPVPPAPTAAPASPPKPKPPASKGS